MSEKYEITVFFEVDESQLWIRSSSLLLLHFFRSVFFHHFSFARKVRTLPIYIFTRWYCEKFEEASWSVYARTQSAAEYIEKKKTNVILDVLNLRWFKMFSHSDLKTIFTYVVAIQMTSSCVFLSLCISGFGQMFQRKAYFWTASEVFIKNNNNAQRKHLFIRLKVDATGVPEWKNACLYLLQLLKIDNDSPHDTDRKTDFQRMLDTFWTLSEHSIEVDLLNKTQNIACTLRFVWKMKQISSFILCCGIIWLSASFLRILEPCDKLHILWWCALFIFHLWNKQKNVCTLAVVVACFVKDFFN